MKEQLERFMNMGRKIEIEVNEIHHETSTGILIEWNQQNAWLPKERIQVVSENGNIRIVVPKWLFEKKFS